MTASKEFNQAVLTGGAYCQQECDCGIVHFMVGPDQGDYSEGELEGLIASEKERPEKYKSSPYSIDYGSIEGKLFVLDCPCESLKKYEDWIWANRRVIVEFFKQKRAKLLAIANGIEIDLPE